MIKREGAIKLKQLAAKFRVVAVVGPRQSGKTTICRKTFPRKPYVSLENPDVAEFAHTDPNGFLEQFKNGAILDEVQKIPKLFSYIQQIVDEKNKPGFFILSGSNNFLMQENITQTLAGRVAYLHLLPCSLKELKSSKLLHKDYKEHIFNGFYPEPNFHKIDAQDWFPNYINTYIERDVRQIKNITNMNLFVKFLRLCAGRCGQILNMNSLANDCGIDNKTVEAWLQLLQMSYIVYLLKPYYNNFNKRVIKTPKLYFYDTGIACSLLGIQNAEQLHSHPLKGGLFENMMLIELLKQRLNKGLVDNLFYWRDKTGNEVDIIIDDTKNFTALEVKAGNTFNSDYIKGINYFEKQIGKKSVTKVVCYTGSSSSKRLTNIELKAWNKLV